ncbi:MAG: hypothetical protein KBA33_06970 [Cloacibacterium sp.]|nr:hypothetical protein [Cloacibacterium sp.]
MERAFQELINGILLKKKSLKFTNMGGVPVPIFYNPIKKKFNVYCTDKLKSDIEFFSVKGTTRDTIKNSASKCKIFYTGECVSKNSVLGNTELENNLVDLVDLSIGFDFLSNQNYIRLPLWILYFFNLDDDLDSIHKKIQNFNNKEISHRSRFASLIATEDIKGIRTKIYNCISKIEKVDCAGKLMHNDDSLKNNFNDHKINYLNHFNFNICPENAQSDGYVTEKVFEALQSGCIPIYNGWSKNPEPHILNPSSFLWFDEESENLDLIEEVKYYQENPKAFCNFKKNNLPFLDTATDAIDQVLKTYNEKINTIFEKLG